MSTIHARIKQNKNKSTAHVIFRIRDGRAIDIIYTSDIVVEGNKWDNESEGYPRKVIISEPEKEEVNQEILSRLRLVKNVYDTQKHQVLKPTTRWLTEQVNIVLFEQEQKKISEESDLIEAFRDYIETFVLNKNRKAHFYTVLHSFERFMTYLSLEEKNYTKLKFADINYNILLRFRVFLAKEYELCKKYDIRSLKPIQKARKSSTLNGYLKILRTFFNHYRKTNNIFHNPFEEFKIKTTRLGRPLHLSVQEFELLRKVYIDNPRLEKIRDIFILNALLGFRVSDFFNLKHSDIINGVIEYYPSKTREYEIFVKVPVVDVAMNIILKYKGNSDYLVPRMSLKTYNKGLKELFQYVGLDRKITYLDTATNQTVHVPLYMKVSSHFARRTFISGLIAAGVSDRIICSMSGHRPHSPEISRYYTIDEETKRQALNNLTVSTDFSKVINNGTTLFAEMKSLL